MPRDHKKVALTYEERLILKGRANGVKHQEIAKHLGVNIRYVQNVYAKAKKKATALQKLSQQPKYSTF